MRAGRRQPGHLDAARTLLHRIDTTAIDSGSVRLQRRIAAVGHLVDRRAKKKSATSSGLRNEQTFG